MTPRLIERIAKAERFLKFYNGGPRNPLMPPRVWKAYLNARLRYLMNDIILEFRRIETRR